MEILFLDTSALVKCYVLEPGTPYMRHATAGGGAALVVVASIAIVECVAALERRVRDGSISSVDRGTAVASFEADLRDRYLVLECDAAVIRGACQLVARHPLRAYDAVQLAVARQAFSLCSPTERTQMVFLSSDADLNAAAAAEGLAVRDPRK